MHTHLKCMSCWAKLIYPVFIVMFVMIGWILKLIKIIKLSVQRSQITASARPARRRHRPLCLLMSADLSTPVPKSPIMRRPKGQEAKGTLTLQARETTHSPFVSSAFPIQLHRLTVAEEKQRREQSGGESEAEWMDWSSSSRRYKSGRIPLLWFTHNFIAVCLIRDEQKCNLGLTSETPGPRRSCVTLN